MSILDRLKNSLHSKKAFTTAEMLLVLLIVSFLILAIPPIIHKKFVKQTKRGMHGRYECWKRTNPSTGVVETFQYLANDKKGIIIGHKGKAANGEIDGDIYGEKVNDGICRFNPSEVASDAQYFSLQAIGGGGGGTYPPYNPEDLTYTNPEASSGWKIIMLSDSNNTFKTNFATSADEAFKSLMSTSNLQGGYSNEASYEMSFRYYDQFDDTKWVRENFPFVTSKEDIIVCSGIGHRGLSKNTTDLNCANDGKHCPGIVLGSHGGYGVCYKIPKGSLAIKGAGEGIKITYKNYPRTYSLIHEHNDVDHYLNYFMVRYDSDESSEALGERPTISSSGSITEAHTGNNVSGNSFLACIEPTYMPAASASYTESSPVFPSKSYHRFDAQGAAGHAKIAYEVIRDAENGTHGGTQYVPDSGFMHYRVVGQEKDGGTVNKCYVKEPDESENNTKYTPDIVISAPTYEVKSDKDALGETTTFTILGGLPGLAYNNLSTNGATYKTYIGDKTAFSSYNGYNRMQTAHTNICPWKDCTVINQKWKKMQFPNHLEWAYNEAKSGGYSNPIVRLLAKYYTERIVWTRYAAGTANEGMVKSSSDYIFPAGISLKYIYNYDSTTYGYAGRTSELVSQFLPKFFGNLEITTGEGGLAGNEDDKLGQNGGDTVIWAKRVNAPKNITCVANDSNCKRMLSVNGGKAVRGGAIGKKLTMSGSETCEKEKDINSSDKGTLHPCMDGGAWNAEERFATSSGFAVIDEFDKKTATPSAIISQIKRDRNQGVLTVFNPGRGGDGGYTFLVDNTGNEQMQSKNHPNFTTSAMAAIGQDNWTQASTTKLTRLLPNVVTQNEIDNYRCYKNDGTPNPNKAPLASDDIYHKGNLKARVCRPEPGQHGAVIIIW